VNILLALLNVSDRVFFTNSRSLGYCIPVILRYVAHHKDKLGIKVQLYKFFSSLLPKNEFPIPFRRPN